jgi:hypothetical protein
MELDGVYFLDVNVFNNSLLDYYKKEISKFGFFVMSDLMVYSYTLATLFSSYELSLKSTDTQEEEIIGWRLLDIYSEAYNEGVKHFDKLFPSPNLYGDNADLIIDSLHNHCYHTRHSEKGLNAPWFNIKSSEPRILSRQVLKKYGFYAGINSKVYDLVLNHKAVFDRFDNGKNCQLCNTNEENNDKFKAVKYNNNKAHNKKQPEMLFDIWLPEGSSEQYKKVIEYLKQEYLETDYQFITEINGILYWNKIPQRGWQQYMAGFVYCCIKNKWIANQYSAPTLVKILNNTFNAKPNVKSFKSISTHPPKEIYLNPFNNLAQTIK